MEVPTTTTTNPHSLTGVNQGNFPSFPQLENRANSNLSNSIQKGK
nr:ribosomal protein S4 [Clematis ranunculoides]WKK45529.1 ribosomal protein S4 [Clematis ranunculoides]